MPFDLTHWHNPDGGCDEGKIRDVCSLSYVAGAEFARGIPVTISNWSCVLFYHIFFGDNYMSTMSIYFLPDLLAPGLGATWTRARLVFCCFRPAANTYLGAHFSSSLRALVRCSGCNTNGSSTIDVWL